MEGMEAVALIVTSLAVPFAVQLVKTGAVRGEKARWLAVGTSLAAGVICATATGAHQSPALFAQACFAAVGGTQAAYAAYKSVGVTSKWLDALAEVRLDKKTDEKEVQENDD